MAETSMQMLDLNQTSNGLSPPMLESSNGSALFQRRIEFHPARKPFKGFSNGGSDFKLETLNPSTSDSRRQGSTMGQLALVGKKTDGSENFDTGLDPELSFGITFRRIGAGLYNLGNTCFLNSVLQCLTYTEPLAAYLQSGKHQNSCHIAGFCALCAIQKHVSRALQSTGTCLSPDDLVRNLRCVSRNFRNSRQEDAHEYMVNLLECMHRCCLPSGVPSESPSAYEKSLVHKIFGGRLRSQVKCLQCSYCSNTFDPFLDLSIDIFKADSLHKALANFTAAEQLDGGAKQYQCQRCKEKVRATKQMTVDKPPYVLTVHLKRFRAHDPGQKNDKKVNFSSTLDLKPFVSGSYEGDLKYTLYGVLVHYGWSTHSGHYYCFVRTSSGMWYSLDDNRVYQVNERTVLEQKAYMLFYVRDRRNIALKKLNNVVQKENIKLNDNGTRISSNYKQDLKRQVQNGSVQNKSMGTVSSAIVQQDELDISLVKTTHSNEAPGHLPESQLQPSSSKLPSEGVSPSSNARQSPSRTSNCDASSLKKGATSSTGGGTNNYNAKESSKKCSSVLVATSSPNFEDPHNSVKHVRAQALYETCSILPLEDSCLASSKDTSGVESQEENSIKSPVQQKCEKIQVEITAIESATIKPLDKNADESSQSLVNGDSINLSGSSTVTHSSFSGEASACKPQKKLKKILKCHSTRGIIFLRSLSIRKRKKHKRSKNRTLKIKIPSNGLLMEANCLPSDMEPSTSENTNKVPLVSTHSKQKRAQFVSVKDANVSAANKVNAQSDSFTNVEDGESRHRIDQNGTFVAIHKPQQNSSDCADHQSAKGIGNQHDQNKDKIQDGFVGMLTRGLEEAVVGRWDDLELPFQAVESAAVENIDIGYTGDEWDEEYDRGKRKKVRQSKLDFGGPNPFQEIATKKMKLKKAKLDRFSSGGDQPFRI